MTDHAQIIREELGWWLLRGQTEKLHRDKALAALDAFEDELERAISDRDNLEYALNASRNAVARLRKAVAKV